MYVRLHHGGAPVTSVTVFGSEPFTAAPEWGRAVLSSATTDGPLPGESTTWLSTSI